MLTRLVLMALAGAIAPSLSHAGPGTASGLVECAGGMLGGGPVVMQLSYSIPPEDVGLPGAVFVGAYNPGTGVLESMLTASGWQAGNGGLPEPYGLYSGGVPAVVQIDTGKPLDQDLAANPNTTDPFGGYQIWITHGVLSPDAEQLVQTRRAALEASRDRLVQAGRWNPQYDDPAFDDEFRYALMQKDANGKQALAVTVPVLDCTTGN